MASVFIHNKVDNYESWRATFDSFEQLRADSGVTRAKVYRTTGDDQGVTVLLDFATGDQAQAFIDFPGFADRLRRAGVIGTPDVWRAEEA